MPLRCIRPTGKGAWLRSPEETKRSPGGSGTESVTRCTRVRGADLNSRCRDHPVFRCAAYARREKTWLGSPEEAKRSPGGSGTESVTRCTRVRGADLNSRCRDHPVFRCAAYGLREKTWLGSPEEAKRSPGGSGTESVTRCTRVRGADLNSRCRDHPVFRCAAYGLREGCMAL